MRSFILYSAAFGLVFLLSACLGEENCSCQDTDGDSDIELDKEDCLQACGELPPIAKDSPCGLDGYPYANECEMACYNVQPSDDPWVCRTRERVCDADHVDRLRFDPDLCKGATCRYDDNGRYAWAIVPVLVICSEPNECFDTMADPCDEETEPVCGKRGVFYCNASVMDCLGDEEADDSTSCSTETVFVGDACSEDEEGTYAIRDDRPCNVCECKSQIWRCTSYLCPGVEPEDLYPDL